MKKVVLRPEVQKFAEQMELKLRAHDHDRGPQGWRDSDPFWLATRILVEQRELMNAMLRWPLSESAGSILKECADVANFAMMVSDVVHRYGIQNVPAAPDGITKIIYDLIKDQKLKELDAFSASGVADDTPK